MKKRNEGKTQTIVFVATEDYKEFRQIHPGQGAWSWFVRECLRRYNDLHSTNPEELLDLVVESVKEDIEDEVEEE